MTYADAKMCRGRGVVCVINSVIFMVPWADVLYAADSPWWKINGRRIRDFEGRRVSVSPSARNYGAREIYRAADDDARGLGRGVIHRGGNSGYQAINLAYLEGAKEIVLLGFDMGHTFGRIHCHEDHPPPLGNAEGVENWIPRFDQLASDLIAAGVSVVNCTRYSRLKCFRRQRLEDYLDDDG